MRKSIVQLINKPYTIKTKTIAGSTVTQTGKRWQLAVEVAIGAAIGLASAVAMSYDPLTKLPDTSFDFEEKARRELEEEESKRELERRLEQLEEALKVADDLLGLERHDNELLSQEMELRNQEMELLDQEIAQLRSDKDEADWLWMDTTRDMENDLKYAASRIAQLEAEVTTTNDLLDIATRENEDLNELLNITSRKTLELRVELSNLRRIQEDAAWKEASSKLEELNTESVNDNEGAIASSTIPATPAAVADGEDSYW